MASTRVVASALVAFLAASVAAHGHHEGGHHGHDHDHHDHDHDHEHEHGDLHDHNEVMELTDELKEFVLNGASAAELKREAIRQGMWTLRRSALNLLTEGATTLSEVLRVSAADF